MQRGQFEICKILRGAGTKSHLHFIHQVKTYYCVFYCKEGYFCDTWLIMKLPAGCVAIQCVTVYNGHSI